MSTPIYPHVEHRLTRLSRPGVPLGYLALLSWRRFVARPIWRRVARLRLAQLDARLEETSRLAWVNGRLRRLAEFDGRVEAADELADTGMELCRTLKRLKREQQELEREMRG